MRLRPPDRQERGERGAIAIMTALLAVVLLGVVALGVDIATQVNQSQMLHDTIDAAAHAGAYRLPASGSGASTDALASAVKNDPTLTGGLAPTVSLFCVVASKWNGSSWAVDTTQIPATCDPTVEKGLGYTGKKCNTIICSIPCRTTEFCNTVMVTGTKPVPYSFAPVIGINAGSTGLISSAACKGPCGKVLPNPMDVVVVADRTSSMIKNNYDYTGDLILGVKGMLRVMTPSQQYVALGTIGRSKTTNHSTAACDTNNQGLSYPSDSKNLGAWVPVNYSNDYLSGTSINQNSSLIKALDCLTTHSGTGTNLASSMKAAARYLLGPSSGFDTSTAYPAGPTRTGTVRKAIIFETDGVPYQEYDNGGSVALNDSKDIGETDIGLACKNFGDVATNAKAPGADILVITVAYNVKMTDKCGASARLDMTMAAAASPKSPGVPSAANFDCGDPNGRISENGDGDNFFCAALGDDMEPIFTTAIGQFGNGIRLIELP
jgi:hypothetical protein